MGGKGWCVTVRRSYRDENRVHTPFAAAQRRPQAESVTEGESMPQKRPFGVTLFLWLVLSLSAWGLLRFFAALRWWNVLDQFDARLSPLYLSITGAGWAIAGVVLLWSIWAGKPWAHPAVPVAVGLWLVEYWIERIFFQSSRANTPFMISISVLLLAVTLISAVNRKTKNFLTRSEEHEQPQDSTPA